MICGGLYFTEHVADLADLLGTHSKPKHFITPCNDYYGMLFEIKILVNTSLLHLDICHITKSIWLGLRNVVQENNSLL